MNNQDKRVIQDFGDEWKRFDHSSINPEDLKKIFDQYFNIFPWSALPNDAEGFDMGCGSGRWAKFVAPKVGKLNCIEPSDAIEVAKKELINYENIDFYKETTETCSLKPDSQDFGYSLGVLHHIPNTQMALNDCVRLLKSGAPILLYLYYDFENKPQWFKAIWKLSDYFRKLISTSPKAVKYLTSTIIAASVYLPLSKLSYVLEKLGFNVENVPLSDYRDKKYYQLKNDALDRFGTRLEQRFSKMKIEEMLIKAGCENIEFSSSTPFWCTIGFKK